MAGAARPVTLARRMEPLLGPIAAVLLGAAAAFFCYAMPAALIGRLLDPAILGGRLPLALLCGLAIGGATWLGFVLLDRAARLPFAAAPVAADAPVLRRADAHPDAPPRRPIFAGSDLGTPLDLVDPLPDGWRAEEPPLAFPDPPRELAPSSAIDDEPEDEMAAAGPTLVPVPTQAAEAIPAETVETIAADRKPPLAALMVRLETGLARKALVLAGAEPNVTALKREIRPIGGTLRAAVEELQQRTAGRR
ncbi:hypothetical protein [Sphingomonas profundi]|uniref:hypothetical protein n=1 Tax=Alterirhizorhabdus profundi TaxID=2681549 RepID=UPI0012E74312|nr:hypothetical protein [Sphingomonas profundi]